MVKTLAGFEPYPGTRRFWNVWLASLEERIDAGDGCFGLGQDTGFRAAAQLTSPRLVGGEALGRGKTSRRG
jgi:hypothetical protein